MSAVRLPSPTRDAGKSYNLDGHLPLRWEQDAGLNEPDETTFYGGGQKGYTDFPSLPLGRIGDTASA